MKGPRLHENDECEGLYMARKVDIVVGYGGGGQKRWGWLKLSDATVRLILSFDCYRDWGRSSHC